MFCLTISIVRNVRPVPPHSHIHTCRHSPKIEKTTPWRPGHRDSDIQTYSCFYLIYMKTEIKEIKREDDTNKYNQSEIRWGRKIIMCYTEQQHHLEHPNSKTMWRARHVTGRMCMCLNSRCVLIRLFLRRTCPCTNSCLWLNNIKHKI